MLGTGLGHTQYWLQAGVTQYTDCTDAAGWAGQSTVVGGHTGQTTPAPGDTGGAWSLHWSLHSRSPGGRMTWAWHMGQCVTGLCLLHCTLLASLQCVTACQCVTGCLAQPALSSTLGSLGLLTLGSGSGLSTASLTHGAATTVLTVQGWARAHQHWKAASPGLWASVRGSHCLEICHATSDWRLAEDLGPGLARGVSTSDLGNWHCWHIPRHRQQPFIKTTLTIWWRLPPSSGKRNVQCHCTFNAIRQLTNDLKVLIVGTIILCRTKYFQTFVWGNFYFQNLIWGGAGGQEEGGSILNVETYI